MDLMKYNPIIDIEVGARVPDFILVDDKDKTIRLSDLRGSPAVLYFYPKDFSSGCTLEAKAFQDNLSKFKKLNSCVVGISADNEEEHESFCTSAKLGYTLLSDTTGEISKSYDSWLDPYSKRNTFMINPFELAFSFNPIKFLYIIQFWDWSSGSD